MECKNIVAITPALVESKRLIPGVRIRINCKILCDCVPGVIRPHVPIAGPTQVKAMDHSLAT